jgi:outer membrane biosynthesis protein TonB
MRGWLGITLVFLTFITTGWTSQDPDSKSEYPEKSLQGRIQRVQQAQTDSSTGHPDSLQAGTIQRHGAGYAEVGASTRTSRTYALLDDKQARLEEKKKALPDWLASLDRAKNQHRPKSVPHIPSHRTASSISRVINEHNTEIKAFYHKYLKLHPDLVGTLTLKIYVTPEGTVNQVDVAESSLENPDFVDRVRSMVQQWTDLGSCERNVIKIYRQKYIFGE